MSITALLRLLLPHLVDFVASLLNPNKPGPTLERMSILVNIMLIVLLGYLGHGAWTIYEQHSDTKSKLEVSKNELSHIQTDLDEARDRIGKLLADLEVTKDQLQKERELNRCVSSPVTSSAPPPTRTVPKKKTVVKPKDNPTWPSLDHSKLTKEINEG